MLNAVSLSPPPVMRTVYGSLIIFNISSDERRPVPRASPPPSVRTIDVLFMVVGTVRRIRKVWSPFLFFDTIDRVVYSMAIYSTVQ